MACADALEVVQVPGGVGGLVRRVVGRIGRPAAGGLPGVGLDHIPPVVDAHEHRVRPHLDPLADVGAGHRVQGPGHLDVEVPVHLGLGEDRDVIGLVRLGEEQVELLGGEDLRRAAGGGAVDAQPGIGPAPGHGLSLGVGKVGEVLARKEAAPYIRH